MNIFRFLGENSLTFKGQQEERLGVMWAKRFPLEGVPRRWSESRRGRWFESSSSRAKPCIRGVIQHGISSAQLEL